MFFKNKYFNRQTKNNDQDSSFPKAQKSKIVGSPLFNVTVMIVVMLGISGFFRLMTRDPINAQTQIKINDSEELSTDEKSGKRDIHSFPHIFEGEVMDTSRRLREIGALGFAASLSILDEAARKRQILGSVNTLIESVVTRNLLPPGLVVKNGEVFSASGKIYIHYKTAPLEMEFVSIPSNPRFGPALILRFPLNTTDGKNIAYFQSTSTSNINLPRAFAPPTEIIRNGWTQEAWRGSEIPGNTEDFAKMLADEQRQLRSFAPAGSDSGQP